MTQYSVESHTLVVERNGKQPGFFISALIALVTADILADTADMFVQ